MSLIGKITGAGSNYSAQAEQRAAQRLSTAANAIAAISSSSPPEAAVAEIGAQNAQAAGGRQEVASAALNQANDIVQRIGVLAAKASDGTLQAADRQALNEEAQALQGELGSLFQNTKYGGQQILQGGTFETNANGAASFEDANGNNILTPLTGIDLSTQAGAQVAITQVASAQSAVTTEQVKAANGGAAMARRSNLAGRMAATLKGVSSAQNEQTLTKALGELSTSQLEMSAAAKVHQAENSMQRYALDNLL